MVVAYFKKTQLINLARVNFYYLIKMQKHKFDKKLNLIHN